MPAHIDYWSSVLVRISINLELLARGSAFVLLLTLGYGHCCAGGVHIKWFNKGIGILGCPSRMNC